MSDDRTKAELQADAEEYGLDTSGNKTALLDRVLAFELGTDDPNVVEDTAPDEDNTVVAKEVEALPQPDPEPELVVEAQDVVLVKMERTNPSFQAVGRTFTREHPFAPVTADQAEHLVHNIGGFRIATPNEVKHYYS